MDAKTNALLLLRGVAGVKPEAAVLSIVGECRRELAMNFDTPAVQIIEFHAAKLGLNTKQFNMLCEKLSDAQHKGE